MTDTYLFSETRVSILVSLAMATLIFAIVLSPDQANAACPIGQSAVDCSYCAHYSCSCSQSDVALPAISVHIIPFSWSHNDIDTSNDNCSGSSYSCSCNAGARSYSSGSLPAPGGACTWDDNRRLPAQLNCSWKDGRCNTLCDNWINQTCCS
jgi:hypothetical protein